MALLVGDDSDGSVYGIGSWDFLWASYTSTTAGSATTIKVRVSSVYTSSKLNAGIYDSTGNLLQHGTAVSGTNSTEWITITLDAAVTINASTTYILAFWSDDSDWMIYYESGITGAYGKYVASAIVDIEEMPDTLPAGSTFGDDYHFQIYADGTEGGGEASGGSTISLWKSQRRKYQHLVVR